MPDHQSGWLGHWNPSVESLPQEATAGSDHQSGLPEHPHMLSQPSLLDREDSKTRVIKMSGENLYFFIALLAASRSRTNVYEKFLLSARVEWRVM